MTFAEKKIARAEKPQAPAEDSGCDCDVIHEEAVARARSAQVSEEEIERLAALLKLFGDRTRLRLLQALRPGELCVCDLAALLVLSKSAVSHQLKLLRMADLVRYRREGQVLWYSLADEHVSALLDLGFEHINES